MSAADENCLPYPTVYYVATIKGVLWARSVRLNSTDPLLLLLWRLIYSCSEDRMVSREQVPSWFPFHDHQHLDHLIKFAQSKGFIDIYGGN